MTFHLTVSATRATKRILAGRFYKRNHSLFRTDEFYCNRIIGSSHIHDWQSRISLSESSNDLLKTDEAAEFYLAHKISESCHNLGNFTLFDSRRDQSFSTKLDASYFKDRNLLPYFPNSHTTRSLLKFGKIKTMQHVTANGFHMTACSFRDESKVEEALEAIKDTIKQEPTKTELTKVEIKTKVPDTTATSSGHGETDIVTVRLVPVMSQPSLVPVPKKSLRVRIVDELKHYYHGFRLLFIDVRVCARLLWQVVNGKSLMRRERKQLVRTTADMFRLVPFLVFIIVPFAEFALPVFLKFFPGMLPSTFQEEFTEKEKRRKRLKLKLEMAKFLQDTIEETALQRKDARGESVHEFVNFMNKIRTSGVETSNEEILKFSKLFEDEITLDNLTFDQLSALCKLVEISAVGPSSVLRFQLEMKLRQLEADDKMIQSEGIESMAIWELQEACRQRGMRSFGVPEGRLKSQLSQWLDLHLNRKIPTSLLLLSRALYLPEHLSTEDQLKATISALPQSSAEEAKVKILEVSGDRVDNKSKLEIIKQEEEMIHKEKMELELLQQQEEQLKIKKAEEAEAMKVEPTIPVGELLVDKATLLDKQVAKEEIHSKDLEQIEDLLEHVAESKQGMKKEVDELKALKEDISEYKENLGELKGVMMSKEAPLAGLEESKSAQRLSKKVEKMISKMDESVQALTAEKQALMDDIRDKEGKLVMKDAAVPKHILDQIEAEKSNLISITELLNAIKKLQNAPDSTKFEMVVKVLDEDKDGVIDYNDAMKVIELLGSENIKIDAEKMAEIMSILRKEKELLEDKKLKKQLQQNEKAATGAASTDSKILTEKQEIESKESKKSP